MPLLKPTRWKILLTIIIGSLWFLWMAHVTSFYGCALVGQGPPPIPGQAVTQPPFYEPFIQIIVGSIGFLFWPLLWCGESAQELNLSLDLAYLLLIIISYIISCSIAFFISKRRKQQVKRKKSK